MGNYAALELRHPNVDLLYAALDDFRLTAIEECDGGLRAFFLTAVDRDAAQCVLASEFPTSPVDVPDDDWARRSQANLQPITVGQITIVPTNPQSPIPNHLSIVIVPSMGFGTGHHATTRLCLAALQHIDVRGKTVLDVGTGSGILAIAAQALGAVRVTGIDLDPDAIQSARENLELNPAISGVTFMVADLGSAALEPADIVTANLTGGMLVRAASRLVAATVPGGTLVLSGLMTGESDDVQEAFRPLTVVWKQSEDEWIGLAVKKP